MPGDDGLRRAFFVVKGQVVCWRPIAGEGRVELVAGRADAERAAPSLAPEAADELLVGDAFLRRPPPELEVLPLAEPAAARAS